jgi:hypothetical protein
MRTTKFDEAVRKFKCEFILGKYYEHRMNAAAAARALGITRNAFNRWLYRARGIKSNL